MEDNPDASIEARMFVNDDFQVEINDEDSLVDSLDEKSYHTILFIRYHTFFQKGSISPDWILLHTGYSINVF